MNEPIPDNLLKDITDFSVLVAWNGAEDKPFYKALLVSQSHSALIGSEPFWGYAVISTNEYNRLIDALKVTQRKFLPGLHYTEISEYYVEIQTGTQAYYCSLGFDQSTIATLDQMANALETANQKPLLDIVSRIRSIF